MPDIYRIDQALFGYRNGHHLLATSSNVKGGAKPSQCGGVKVGQ